MADTKISQLPAATTPLSGTELVPLVQSGATVQTPISDVTAPCAKLASANTFATDQTVTGTLVMASSFLRNRIINGDMRIDQRNAGASIAIGVSSIYGTDRWQSNEDTDGGMTVQQSTTTPPTGFTHSMLFTTTVADASLGAAQFTTTQQKIEGLNVSDLGWGAAGALSVTVSFWVKSSLTGSHSGALQNSAQNRSYPFSYTISAANTWEQKTVTIPGDTSGTWLTDTGIGIRLVFDLGSGTSVRGTASTWAASNLCGVTGAVSVISTLSATWQITGVQLEAGSTATPFERRQYGQELALCQRYYFRVTPGNNTPFGLGQVTGASTGLVYVSFPAPMRIPPNSVEQTGTVGNYKMWQSNSGGAVCTSVPAISSSTLTGSAVLFTSTALAGTAGQATGGLSDGTGYLGWSAEL